jgi:hypothetical protein
MSGSWIFSVRASGSIALLAGALALAISCRTSPDKPTPGGPGQPGPTPPGTEPPPAHDVVINRELMITNLSVVNDARTRGPDGPWSFGGLITGMAGDTDPSKFLKQWLKTWEIEQRVNGQDILPRKQGIRTVIIDPWKQRDNPGKTVSDDEWQVNLANAPFRLLAIVNRLDLMKETTTSVESAGEGRFVFGVLGPGELPVPFTVIFEFEQVATTREQLRGWARQWHALGTIGATPFDETYKAALQVITDRFSGKNAAPGKPNGSALNQLRTNEIALVASSGEIERGWELREFRIVNGLLTPSPTLQSPANSFQNNPTLTAFINANEVKILDGTFEILPTFNGAPFLAASSIVAPPVRDFTWKVPPPVNNEARFKVALASCNGCHHRETATTNFVHVDNRALNNEAKLSRFLIGNGDGKPFMVEDQGTGGFSRPFNDLVDRAAILKETATEAGAARLHSMRAPRRFRVH